MQHKQIGFSLLEVLIASFIMFISLVAFSSVFSSALISSDKAESNVSSAAYTNLIVSQVSSIIYKSHHLNQVTGNGKLLARTYDWQAVVKESSKPPARYFGQTLTQAEHVAKIWEVRLNVDFKGKESTFVYEEVTW